MSASDEQRQRIKDKVAASQERLLREGKNPAALPSPARFPDAYPPEDYRGLAGEYPWLAVAAGLGAGMLAGALLPKRFVSRFGKKAWALATVAGELGLALSRQAQTKAGEAGRDGADQLRSTIGRIAGPARSKGRSTGALIAREAVRLAARVRR